MAAKPPLRKRPCPTCQKLVTWSPEARYRPFCSERCRLIDLGEWASESFRIPDQGSNQQSTLDFDGQLPPASESASGDDPYQ